MLHYVMGYNFLQLRKPANMPRTFRNWGKKEDRLKRKNLKRWSMTITSPGAGILRGFLNGRNVRVRLSALPFISSRI